MLCFKLHVPVLMCKKIFFLQCVMAGWHRAVARCSERLCTRVLRLEFHVSKPKHSYIQGLTKPIVHVLRLKLFSSFRQ